MISLPVFSGDYCTCRRGDVYYTMISAQVCGSFIRRTAFATEETIKCPPGLQFHLPTCSCNFHSNNQCPRNCPGESQQSSSGQQLQARRKHTKHIWSSDVTFFFQRTKGGDYIFHGNTFGYKISHVSTYSLPTWCFSLRNQTTNSYDKDERWFNLQINHHKTCHNKSFLWHKHLR